MKRIVTAAAVAVTVWGIKHWYTYHRNRMSKPPRHETESWENEGGALAPHPMGLETSQVPR